MIRRTTAILLLLMGLAFMGCRATIPPDEVTTRMNAEDEAALDDAAPQGGDAGVTRERRPY